MATFETPKGYSKNALIIQDFRGVDLYNAPANVSLSRSPEAPNMIRDVPGKVRKRCGYHRIGSMPGRINGVFSLRDGDSQQLLFHAGTGLYDASGARVLDGVADQRSWGIQFQKRLYLLDGKTFRVAEYSPKEEEDSQNGWSCRPVSEDAYVPVVLISRDPSGGGVSLEPFNLLQSKWEEDFLGQASIKNYQLSTAPLDDLPVQVQVLQTDGSWKELEENSDFTVNRTTGMVQFVTAPGASPVTGRDNVKIIASRKDHEKELEKIGKCRFGILYGVNGAADRLFVSGNPDAPNQDWYSQREDPTFFGDIWFSSLGQESGSIVGYSILSSNLATHKDKGEDGRNVILRQGTSEDGKAAFPVTATLQGQGALSFSSFGYLSGEPLFLTTLGIYAITPADITGERYAQNRSFYLNKALTEEAGLADAAAYVWRDFYLLAVGEKVYILDGLSKSYEKNSPYSTYQYEGYYWLNIGARVFWEQDGLLCFGREDGVLMAFYDDPTLSSSYYDDGKPVSAYWDIPNFSGRSFNRKKTVRQIAVRLASAANTSIRILARLKGAWKLLLEELFHGQYWDYGQLDYGRLTYNNDSTPRTYCRKKRLRGYDSIGFRLMNDRAEPFGLYEVTVEFTETSYYRK